MSDTTPPGGRVLSEPERQAFRRLGLTPGHWAALAPAPLFYRAGVRNPNRHTAADLAATDRLRQALRTLEGLSEEAAEFWDRLGDGARRAEAALAARLLAWHLATDLTFARRQAFFLLLRQVAGHFAHHGAHAPRTPAEVTAAFRRLVDEYLPQPAFAPETDPPPAPVAPPPPGALDALAGALLPVPPVWPPLSPAEVPRRMPAVTRLLGEPVREWWGAGDPARRAVERGLAGAPFDTRDAVCTGVYMDWFRALELSHPPPRARALADQFVTRLEEWVDEVRRAARDRRPAAEEPPPAEPAVVLAPPAPPPADPGRSQRVAPKPAAKREPERVAAAVAAPFMTVSLDEALARARSTSVAEVCAWVDTNRPLLFDDCRDEAAREVAVVRTEAAVPPALWIVGDLHADVLALVNVVAHAEAQATPERPAHFLFLGDFVDRGVHDHEALLFLFRLAMDHPERVCVVPGNHDIDLQYDEAAGRFRVTIDPAEYCEALNAAIRENAPDAAERVALARAFLRFCAARPKAVFFPDGTLFTHGGFPHTDAQKDVAALSDLCKPRCVDDFLWARIAESARVKRPNRGSRGHEFGWDTLLQFARLASERLELPVRRLVRGHDHVPDRWQEYPEYADNGVPVLTLNAMGRLLDGEPARRDGRPHPLPAVGRYVPNHLPEVVLLSLDPAEVDRAFARPKPAESANEAQGRAAEGGP